MDSDLHNFLTSHFFYDEQVTDDLLRLMAQRDQNAVGEWMAITMATTPLWPHLIGKLISALVCYDEPDMALSIIPYADPHFDHHDALDEAAAHGHLALVQALMPISVFSNSRALFMAVQEQEMEMIQFLLPHSDHAQIEVALLEAVQQGYPEIIALLWDEVPHTRSMLIHMINSAASLGLRTVVEQIIPDIFPMTPNEFLTVVTGAVKGNQSEMVHLLLQEQSIADGDHELTVEAAKANNSYLVRQFFNDDLSYRNVVRTAKFAVAHQNIDILEQCLPRLNHDMRHSEEHHALLIEGVKSRNMHVLNMILPHCDPAALESDALVLAVIRHNIPAIDLLFDFCDVDAAQRGLDEEAFQGRDQHEAGRRHFEQLRQAQITKRSLEQHVLEQGGGRLPRRL